MKQRTFNAFKTLLTNRSLLKRMIAGIVLLSAMATLYTKHVNLDKDQAETEKDFSGKVIRVIDGDTIKLLTEDNHTHRVRLAFIDTPEIGQAYGQRARKNLLQLIEGQQVRIKVKDIDHYGRVIAQVCLLQEDINLAQIKKGYAWHYQYYAKRGQSPEDYSLYAKAEQAAKEAHLGLWREKHPIPPWKYRANSRR